jgi:hypothetical protein
VPSPLLGVQSTMVGVSLRRQRIIIAKRTMIIIIITIILLLLTIIIIIIIIITIMIIITIITIVTRIKIMIIKIVITLMRRIIIITKLNLVIITLHINTQLGVPRGPILIKIRLAPQAPQFPITPSLLQFHPSSNLHPPNLFTSPSSALYNIAQLNLADIAIVGEDILQLPESSNLSQLTSLVVDLDLCSEKTKESFKLRFG